MRCVHAAAVRAHRRKVPRQAGFALIVVMTTVAVLGAVVGEFGYNARVELEAAANARDTLRAEYAARSGINLSRILIKVQQSVIDKMFNGPPLNADFQIIDFAPYMMGAFGGGDEERKSFGDLLGFDASSLKGLGLGKGVTIDPVLGTEDGKININCGGGLMSAVPGQAPPNQPPPNAAAGQRVGPPLTPGLALYNMLVAVMFPPRYNRLFESEAADGQFYTRDDLARAILDWSDIDESRFDPVGSATGSGSAAGEDYRYDSLRDPYKARNNYYDTTEELNLVKGVGDDWWGSFGSMFTVYGGCKINIRAVSQDNWPITAAIIRAAAANPQDPILLDDTAVAAMSQQVGALMQLPGIISNPQAFCAAVNGGGMPGGLLPGNATAQGANAQIPLPFSNLSPIKLDCARLAQIAKTGPRQVYRIESTGSVKRAGDKRIQVRVRAVFDSLRINQQSTNSNDPSAGVGSWVYWRME